MNITISRPGFFQKIVQQFAMSSWGVRMAAPISHHLDRAVLALTGGRHTLVNLITGLPIVEVTMTGAKSGLPRTLPSSPFRMGTGCF